MNNRNSITPSLPDVDGKLSTFRAALLNLIRQNASVTGALQTPPVCRLDLNDADFALTAGSTVQVEWTNAGIDTHGWFDSANYRWTPKRYGYYAFSFCALLNSTTLAAGYAVARVKKNGTEIAGAVSKTDGSAIPVSTMMVSDVCLMNGSSDYLETFVTVPAASTDPVLQGLARRSWFAIRYVGTQGLAI